VWALTGPEHENLAQVSSLGFQWIDIQPHMLASTEAQTTARQLHLQVSSIGASFGIPDGTGLDSVDEEARNIALSHVGQALAHGAALGATAAYVVPGIDTEQAALSRYAKSIATAAERAATYGIRFCIEHFPGTALATASDTLDFIRGIGHPNLYLLFDIGHIQMAGEDPAAIIHEAGSRMGYVHLDDNDGQGDLHWSLLDGMLTEDSLQQTFVALSEIGYSGAISLELNPQLPDPYEALKHSREIVMNVAAENLRE
jgi:hydroxypyruvate isomerase